MKVPLEISFRGVEKTDYIEDLIHEKAAKLRQVCDQIISCRVAVEVPQQHQRVGRPFRVRIDMRVPPGHELVVKRESATGDMHDDLPKVIRSAFDAARRQLKELADRERGDVKTHPEQQMTAVVVRLFPEEGYGFIRDIDGQEYFFHQNSVLNDDFERIEVGTGVRFVGELGAKGPQASTVQIVDKPGVSYSKVDEPKVDVPLGWEEEGH